MISRIGEGHPDLREEILSLMIITMIIVLESTSDLRCLLTKIVLEDSL
jgi:hypothetical protein